MKTYKLTQLERQLKIEQRLKQRINQVTSTVIMLLNIDTNLAALVMLCGTEGDRNNYDAVKSWVTKFLCCASCMKKLRAERIAAELHKHLNQQLNDYYD